MRPLLPLHLTPAYMSKTVAIGSENGSFLMKAVQIMMVRVLVCGITGYKQ